MDEVDLPDDTRDPRTGLRRLAPEIESVRDQIVDRFENKPFSELKTFVQKVLEIEEDETKRLGALAARVYMLRKRIIDFEETIELIPAEEPAARRDMSVEPTSGNGWARVRVLEDCEVNGMRLPEGIIVDVSGEDAKRLIDSGHAELRDSAGPNLSENDDKSDASESAGLPDDYADGEDAFDEGDDTDEDIVSEDALDEGDDTGEDIVSEVAPDEGDDTDEDIVSEEIVSEDIPEPEDEANETIDEANKSDDEDNKSDDEDNKSDDDKMDEIAKADASDELISAAAKIADDVETDARDAESAPDAKVLDTSDHALATAIAETAEAFNEIDVALAADVALEHASSDIENQPDDGKDAEADES